MNRRLANKVFVALSALLCGISSLSHAHHRKFTKSDLAPKQYSELKDHHPQSIGKVYMGREIATVMGFAGVAWLERESREKEESLSQLVRALNVKKGQSIADIGAGSGVLSFPIAKLVGPKGKVYAVDIQQEMLDRLKVQAKRRKLSNVRGVLGGEKTTNLKPASVDLAFMVDVYHELEYPLEMIQNIRKILKPNGMLVLIEYRSEDKKLGIKKLHKMSISQIKKELLQKSLGFSLEKIDNRLPKQHMVFFKKTS